MKKESKLLIFYLSLVGTIFIVNYFIRIAIHPTKVDDPIYYISGSCVAVVFLFGYLLYSWKSDMHTFLKRFLFSIPFALCLLIFIHVMGYGNSRTMIAGLFVSLLLLFKTPDWKRHYAAILIPFFIFIILLKFVVLPLLYLSKSTEGSPLRVAVAFTSVTPILSFSMLYISKLLYKSAIEWRAILIRSIKFSIAVSVFFTMYLILTNVGNQVSLSLPVQLLLNTLLSISFLVIGYKFDLLLVERKKTTKKNRRSELHTELHEFYLNEREKLKRRN